MEKIYLLLLLGAVEEVSLTWFNYSSSSVRVSIQASDGDVLVMYTVMYAPAVVTTVTQLRLGADAVKVVKPDLYTAWAVSGAE